MKRVFIALFLIGFYLIFTGHLYAAEPYNERWTCLTATRTSDSMTKPDQVSEWVRFARWAHSAYLTTKTEKKDKPLGNKNTYIVECLQIPTNLNIPASVRQEFDNKIPTEVCTTGNSQADLFIWKNDRLAQVQKLYSAYDKVREGVLPNGYSYEGYFKDDLTTKYEPESTNNIIKTNTNGDFAIGKFIFVSHTWTGTNTDRKFMAYNRFDKDAGLGVEGLGAQQQGKLEFDFDTANKNCVKIAWDPYGTVFDTFTLEPIPGAAVALYIKKQSVFRLMENADMPGGYIQNPSVTKEDGYFSFVVPDGTYKLGVSAAGYLFPSVQAVLQSNASVIYSDFYKGEDIIQRGAMVHRDIPIDPTSPSSTQKYAAKIIGLFQNVTPEGNTIIDGRVSHPLAKINSYCKTITGIKGALNTTTQADKHGQFKLTFKPSLCDENSGEMYAIVEVEAIDLTKQLTSKNIFNNIWAWIIGKRNVEAALVPISYSFDPILNYVEGYAMDSTSIHIPNATVGVYAPGDRNPIREVKADVNGKFAIISDLLPKGPYELKYKNVMGATTSVSTSRFIAQNLTTIQKEKINLYAQKNTVSAPARTKLPTKSPTIDQTSSTYNQQNISKTTNNPSSSMNQKVATTDMQNNAVKNQIIIMIMLMFFIMVIGGMIALFMFKKQNTPTSF